MWIQKVPALAIAAAIPFVSTAYGAVRADVRSVNTPEVAAPFAPSACIIVSLSDVRSAYLKGQYSSSSTAMQSPVSFNVEPGNGTPSELINEFRRLSGLTWAQISDTFEISSRAVFDWAANKSVSAKNHQRLGEALTALRFIDRGSAHDNKSLLLGDAFDGQTYLDLFRSRQFEVVRELAGPGAGRPSFLRAMSAESLKFNMPPHWGQLVQSAIDVSDVEIQPLNPPNLRRAKARQRQ